MIKKINTMQQDLEILTTPARKVETKMDSPLSSALEPGSGGESVWPKYVLNHIQDLKDTAANKEETALGLASCQIWDKPDEPPLAIFVVKIRDSKDPKKFQWVEFINPEITTSGGTIKNSESCLSVPRFSKTIRRKKNVHLRFQTLGSADFVEMTFLYRQGFLPIVIQHEYDHLLGKLIKKVKLKNV